MIISRKGLFIGAYVPPELKETLERRAKNNKRTVSQELTLILTETLHGTGLPTGSIDRRDATPVPRRRRDDPHPRRRTDDAK